MSGAWLPATVRTRPAVWIAAAIVALTGLLSTVVIVAVGGQAPLTVAATEESPFVGLATWVDMYDWTKNHGGGTARLGPSTVDRIAERGVRTLELQATASAPGELLERSTLEEWVSRAKGRGLQVVLWYVPTFVDTPGDVRTLTELADLRPDGIGVDIESKAVTDVAERSRRLVQLSQQLRSAVPDRPLQAIVLPPTYLEEVTPTAWPGFPWAELKGLYDVWSPMAYWTDRLTSSGFRDATRYTNANLARIRELLGDPAAPIHMIGGIGDKATPASVRAFASVVQETKVLGASLYDWRTTTTGHWDELQRIGR